MIDNTKIWEKDFWFYNKPAIFIILMNLGNHGKMSKSDLSRISGLSYCVVSRWTIVLIDKKILFCSSIKKPNKTRARSRIIQLTKVGQEMYNYLLRMNNIMVNQKTI